MNDIATSELKSLKCKSKNPNTLCKAIGKGQIEIKNDRNNHMNYFNVNNESQPVKLRGCQFQNFSFDLYCHDCVEKGVHHYPTLLGRAFGTDLKVEIKCRRCKTINYFDIEKMLNKKLRPLSMDARKRYIERLTQAMS